MRSGASSFTPAAFILSMIFLTLHGRRVHSQLMVEGWLLCLQLAQLVITASWFCQEGGRW